MSTIQNQKVTLTEKIGYGLGDCSANLVFQMMMIYQTKFYTDIFGLEGAIAGTVMLVARIVDAFVDPTVGILSDRTNSRWGKYRPWVLWTALPFMVFYVLAFYNPGIEDKGLVALYATISYTLLMTMYSFNNTPYSSLGGVMSADIKERTSITSIRFIFSTIAQFVVQGLTLPLVSKFSDGGDKAHGWLCTISLFAIIGFIFLVTVFFSAKERIQEINPEVTVEIFPHRLDKNNYHNIIKEYDLIVDCFDSYASKFLLNEIAVKENKPLIHGGVSEFNGQITVIVPHKTPCLRCIFPEPDFEAKIPEGNLSPVVNLVASIEALEALKWILGIPSALQGHLLTIDALNMTFKSLKINSSDQCVLCS